MAHRSALEIELLDPGSLAVERRLPYGPMGNVVNWFHSLARVGDAIVAVRAGESGSMPASVRDLQGELVWEYRKPATPKGPSAKTLRAADLDGDGAAEFYALAQDALARLDAAGREVWTWTLPTEYAMLAAMAPARGTTRGWLVLTLSVGESGGERIRRIGIWDDQGRVVAGFPVAEAFDPKAVVDWPDGERGVLLRELAGNAVLVVSASGEALFRYDFDGMAPMAGVSVRFEPDGAPT